MSLREQYVPRGVATTVPAFIAQADGARVRDVEGKEFIDFAAGISVLNLGHRPEVVVAAIKEQLDRFLHMCAHVALYEPYVKLAERLAHVTPGSHAKKTLLVNSGAEAVENAVKIARAATGRRAVVCLSTHLPRQDLHGKTPPAKPSTSLAGPFPEVIAHRMASYAARREGIRLGAISARAGRWRHS
jgi:4-aminobutyrate aminotransferase/(S)-3-amino-2-methylpropionate transaminase